MTACIDVHSHFFPLEVLDVLRGEGARYRTPVRAEADGRLFVVTPERPYGPIGPGFYDVGRRREFMAAQGMGSPTPREVVEAQAALAPSGRERAYRDTAAEFLGLT